MGWAVSPLFRDSVAGEVHPSIWMKTGKPAFEYYIHDESKSFRIELSGYLNRETATQAGQVWRTASSTFGNRQRLVDVTRLTSMDEEGSALLTGWHRDGVEIIAKSKDSRLLAESAIGEPLPDPEKKRGMAWLRQLRSWRNPFATQAMKFLALLTLLTFPMRSHAATLKPETTAAWDKYVASVEQDQQTRVNPGAHFLRVFEDPKQLEAVRRGEIVAMPAPGGSPRRVSGGLIHHWVGMMFLPGIKLDEALNVSSDIKHYKAIFHPYVVDSKLTSHHGNEDQFVLRLMNKTLFLKLALDAEYVSRGCRIGERRYYSVSTTKHVEEIEKYEQPEEHRNPEGEGLGYIWKMFSISRMEQRDGGTYIELEALALSRDIPMAFRFAVDPVVRRISRNSIVVTLEQTRKEILARAKRGPEQLTSDAAHGHPAKAVASGIF
jgi:ABC-type transporter Mla MlaB component